MSELSLPVYVSRDTKSGHFTIVGSDRAVICEMISGDEQDAAFIVDAVNKVWQDELARSW